MGSGRAGARGLVPEGGDHPNMRVGPEQMLWPHCCSRGQIDQGASWVLPRSHIAACCAPTAYACLTLRSLE